MAGGLLVLCHVTRLSRLDVLYCRAAAHTVLLEYERTGRFTAYGIHTLVEPLALIRQIENTSVAGVLSK